MGYELKCSNKTPGRLNVWNTILDEYVLTDATPAQVARHIRDSGSEYRERFLRECNLKDYAKDESPVGLYIPLMPSGEVYKQRHSKKVKDYWIYASSQNSKPVRTLSDLEEYKKYIYYLWLQEAKTKSVQCKIQMQTSGDRAYSQARRYRELEYDLGY